MNTESIRLNKMREVRIERGATLRELREVSDMDIGFLSRVESGKLVTRDTGRKIASALGVALAALTDDVAIPDSNDAKRIGAIVAGGGK